MSFIKKENTNELVTNRHQLRCCYFNGKGLQLTFALHNLKEFLPSLYNNGIIASKINKKHLVSCKKGVIFAQTKNKVLL